MSCIASGVIGLSDVARRSAVPVMPVDSGEGKWTGFAADPELDAAECIEAGGRVIRCCWELIGSEPDDDDDDDDEDDDDAAECGNMTIGI